MSGFAQLTLNEFLAQLSAKTPTPGGGAVASSVGAMGAALARMVVAYSLGKKNLAEHQPALQQADESLKAFGTLFMQLADEDAAAYGLVSELQKLPPGDARRERDLPAACAAAIAAPRATLGAGCDLLRLIERLAPITNRVLRSDLAVAGVLAESAAKSGYFNVQANIETAPESERKPLREESGRLIEDAVARRARIEAACA